MPTSPITVGPLEFNETELEIRRTITTEISDVGTTTLDIPDAALAKLAD